MVATGCQVSPGVATLQLTFASDCQSVTSDTSSGVTMPVSCYICGRDFGTKSITIHIPNCIKKWENEQKKLPKSQRRPPPSAPVNLDKVISGELKGEELNKFNGEVLQEWNDTALVPCNHCGRCDILSFSSCHCEHYYCQDISSKFS